MATRTPNQRRRMRRRKDDLRDARAKRRKALAKYASQPETRIRGWSGAKPSSKMPDDLTSLFPHWDPNAETPVRTRLERVRYWG